MYQGKFDSKNKKTTVNVSEVVSQRNSAAAKQPVKTSPVKDAPAKAAPARDAAVKPAPAKAPAKEAPAKTPAKQPAPAKKQKRGPRVGGIIFYTMYFMFILVFFLATYIGLQWIHSWLSDYEAAQPTTKCQEVFDELFSDPDWGAMYDAAGVEDTPYEGKEEFVAYMENKIGDTRLTYLETSAGLSGDKKYIVRLGDEKVASFTLVDENSVGVASLENIGSLPSWVLGDIEVFYQREETFFIENMDGHTVFVNDVALDESHKIQIATTVAAEKYLPEGVTGFSMCTQQITDLMATPTVTIFDETGAQMPVSYDEATKTFTEQTEVNTITEEEKTVALEAARTYCLWMIEEVKNRATMAKYFDTSSDIYKTVVNFGELWMQDHNGYEFVDETVSEYSRYTDDLFSVKVKLTMNVTRTNGTVKPYPYEQTLFFEKQDTGKWLAFEMTNVDVQQPVGRVRLTFMQDDTVLLSNFFFTDAAELITPIVPVPEGKVFSGWVTQGVNEEGVTTMTVVFQPDETGKVTIPDGTYLEPMTLYALFEDADSAAADTPETTEGA